MCFVCICARTTTKDLQLHDAKHQQYCVLDLLCLRREEVFGPVFTIVKFRTDADAIALANDCPFGLGSTVFSRSKSRANKIACQLQVGCTSSHDTCLTRSC